MGHRIIQRILECNDCKRTPDDGEDMWEMSGHHICVDCIDKEEDVAEHENQEVKDK